jgi:hypothetical protein
MAVAYPVPVGYWNLLSPEDQSEYIRIRTNFHQGEKLSSKDCRIVTFRRELTILMAFLERDRENLEVRCIVAGVCFADGIVCVNTRQLKGLLRRCKSSINGAFQQLGYVALRTRTKTRGCVVGLLPSLQQAPAMIKQWSVRVVTAAADFCFVSSFSAVGLPEIHEEDLLKERPRMALATVCARLLMERQLVLGPEIPHFIDVPMLRPVGQPGLQLTTTDGITK